MEKKPEAQEKKIEIKEGHDHSKEKKTKETPKKPTDKQKIQDLTDSLQRLQAEFENYKKRVEKEKHELVNYSKADMIFKLLPFLDTFEMALQNSKDQEKFKKGIEMVYAQLYSLLETEGLQPIKSVGEKFDPFKHEVLLKVESDKEEDTILEDIQKGYMLFDRVLRPSKVKVSKKKSEDPKKHSTK